MALHAANFVFQVSSQADENHQQINLYQIYILEARTPDILKIPNRCTFWKHDPQTSETFLSDIHSGSSNPGHSENSNQIYILKARTPDTLNLYTSSTTTTQ